MNVKTNKVEDPLSSLEEPEEKKINLEITVEAIDDNNSAGVSDLTIHAQVDNDQLDMTTQVHKRTLKLQKKIIKEKDKYLWKIIFYQLGREGVDVYSEARVEDEGETSSIKINVDTEQQDQELDIENTLAGGEENILVTLDNNGVEQTKQIKLELQTDSEDSDQQEAERHIRIKNKRK